MEAQPRESRRPSEPHAGPPFRRGRSHTCPDTATSCHNWLAIFLTDGGIETTLVFLEGWTSPISPPSTSCAHRRGRTPSGNIRTYAELARRHGAGLVLETATWRSNLDWGTKLGYGARALDDANRHAVRLLEVIRTQYGSDDTPIVISGCIGPRGDGYVPDIAMSEREAEAYHRRQIETFADTAADLVTAITMNYAEEAAGVALAARGRACPSCCPSP